MSWLEEFWADILSEEPDRITAVWLTLDSESQQSIYTHLQRMATEDGWMESQQKAAQAALDALDSADEID